MKNFAQKLDSLIKMEESTGNNGGAGGAPATQQSQTPPETEEDGSDTDEFGYPVDKSPEKEEPKAPETKTGYEGDPSTEKKPEEVKPGETKTGYETEQKPEEKKPEEKKPEEKKPEEKKPEEGVVNYKEVLKDLPEEEAKVIGDLAEKHKPSKELLDDYLAIRREEIAAEEKSEADFEREQKNAVIAKRAQWRKELVDDKDFGGENFNNSLVKVQNVMTQYFPQTQKALTQNNGVLPPYLMKEFAQLADQVFKTETLKTGDAIVKTEKKEESPEDWYNNPE